MGDLTTIIVNVFSCKTLMVSVVLIEEILGKSSGFDRLPMSFSFPFALRIELNHGHVQKRWSKHVDVSRHTELAVILSPHVGECITHHLTRRMRVLIGKFSQAKSSLRLLHRRIFLVENDQF